MVFAHYMVCCPTADSGATVADYKNEIREAQIRGIDGFALNAGGWTHNEPFYKQRSLQMYEAARQLNTGFKLFISADYCCGLTSDETRDMVDTFRDHPNQLRVNGKPVLSTFAGEGSDLTNFIDQTFGTGANRKIVFVPYYYPRPDITELPGQSQVDEVFNNYPTLDGYFYFGAAGGGDQIAASSSLLAQKWVGAGKIYMAPLTPYYRAGGSNYRLFETMGMSALEQEWKSAIDNNATWVEFVTWNDWAESSYLAPFGAPAETKLWGGHWGQKMLSHTAYLDASRYYIDWFKTGKRPAITKDKLFYFYRLHPKALQALVQPSGDATLGRPANADALHESVFVSLFLKAPAQLTISSGDQQKTFALAAGVQDVEMPFAPGSQRFVLKRGKNIVFDKTGEHEISATDASSRFNYFAGQASAHSSAP